MKSDRPEVQAFLEGVGPFTDEKTEELFKVAEKMSDLLQLNFQANGIPVEPTLFALALMLIEASQDHTKFTRETFLDWMSKQWDAMEKYAPSTEKKNEESAN